METEKRREWPALRCVHLLGGCRAISAPHEDVVLYPHAVNGKQASFTLSAYGTLYDALERLGLGPVGVDFISHILQTQGRMPIEWRPYLSPAASSWGPTETADNWGNISHGAYDVKDGRLWDLARRISHQLRVCAWRLREISNAYEEQLDAIARDNEFRDGARFADGFTWLGYLSIQAFLVDACVMRDYLAEFCAQHCYGNELRDGGIGITSMGSLCRFHLNHQPGGDEFTDTLKTAVTDGGWLRELGDYRDLVVHSVPLARAQGLMLARRQIVRIGSGSGLPSVMFPIPDHPRSLSKLRSSGALFVDFTQQLEDFKRVAADEGSSIDGLTYAHQTIGRLSDFAARLLSRSPIAPKVPVIDDSDLIGGLTMVQHAEGDA